MIVNTRTGQGPAPCTMNVDCPEPEAKPEPETHTSISVNVHVRPTTPIEAVNRAHGWLTLGNAGCAIHADPADLRRIAKACNQLALAGERGRVFKGEF